MKEMKDAKDAKPDNFTSAQEAIGNLLFPRLEETFSDGWRLGIMAHSEIELLPVPQKAGAFYRNFLPLFKNVVVLMVGSYRRYFKLALAHPRRTGDPSDWAWTQLRPAVGVAVECIFDWYIVACEGSNRYLQPVASVPFRPGQTVSIPVPLDPPEIASREAWRAPSWLFAVGPMVGIGALKTKHVPSTDSEERLSAAHTRLLLKGARRVFLWKLGAELEIVRNEEIAAAGAIPGGTPGEQVRVTKKSPKYWLRGFEGLGPKVADLSRYMHVLTDKQQTAFSLKCEYGLKPAEVASRMGLDRKTAYEHLKAADKKINEAFSNERRKARLAKNPTD